MKKFLLLSAAALLSTASVWAIEEEDITPKGYDWANVEAPTFCEMSFPTANFPVPVAASIAAAVPSREFNNNGMIGVAGGQMSNQDNYANLRKGCSIVDLGGTVGKVFCYSGANSQINDKLKELYGADMQIPLAGTVGGWYNMNFFSDQKNTPTVAPGFDTNTFPTDCNVRVRVVMNVFANELSESTPAINTAYCPNNDGSILPKNDNTASNAAVCSGEFCKFYDDDPEIPEEDDNGNLIWDPTRWLVYEFDTFVPADDSEGKTYCPIRLKVEMNNGSMANSTLFIKELKFLKVTGNEDPIVNARPRTWKTFTVAPSVSAGVASVATSAANLYSVNGNEVTFAADAAVFTPAGAQVAKVAAGASTSLASGLYVAKVAGKGVKFVIR